MTRQRGHLRWRAGQRGTPRINHLVDEAQHALLLQQRRAEVQELRVAEHDERRKVLHVDVAAEVAVVLDVEPDEANVGARDREARDGGLELLARRAPGRAQHGDRQLHTSKLSPPPKSPPKSPLAASSPEPRSSPSVTSASSPDAKSSPRSVLACLN